MAGDDNMQTLYFLFAFIAVLALIGVAAWLVRRFATHPVPPPPPPPPRPPHHARPDAAAGGDRPPRRRRPPASRPGTARQCRTSSDDRRSERHRRGTQYRACHSRAGPDVAAPRGWQRRATAPDCA